MFPAMTDLSPFAQLAANLTDVHARIAAAARAAGRAADAVQLLAVSKTFPAEAVRAAAATGQTAFGENYVQEGVAKVQALADLQPKLNLEWHFIGPLQSNKTKQVAEHFAWVHGIERLKIAERLAAQRPTNLPPLQVLIQVNVSGELSKSGVVVAEVLALARGISGLPALRLRGLMAIPEPTDDLALQHARFRSVADCLKNLIQQGFPVDTLSMGMSADLESAIAEGSTLVRVGTAIFGQRSARTNKEA